MPDPAVARTLVIPMFREATRIAASVQALAGHAPALGDLEVVLVDDGSPDDTADVARRALSASPDLQGRVISLTRNHGKGGAIAAGIAAARGDVIAFADADLSAPPPAIVSCFELIEQDAADVVVTTRHTESSVITERPPAARRLTTRLFQRFLSWRGGLDRFSDTQCGLKAFTATAARQLFDDLSVQRFAFDVEVLLRAEVAGFRVIEAPIEWRHVDQSSVRPVRDGARMVMDVMRLRGRVRRWQAQGPDGLPMLAVLERRHWWYVSHRDLCTDAVATFLDRSGPRDPVAVDVDAGTGTMVDRYAELGVAVRLALDARPDTVRFGRGPASDPAGLVAATHDAVPLPDASVDVLSALDVLAFAADDVGLLREFARVVRPGGLVVVTGPALERMWSDYDVSLGHHRRYERATLRAALLAAGLEPQRISHFHAWLTPFALGLSRTPLRRVLLRRPERATFVDARVNRVLLALTWLERHVARHVDLPTGQAILGVARRP